MEQSCIRSLRLVALLLLVALTNASCQRTLKPETAAEMIRKELAADQPVTDWVNGVPVLAKLDKLGLLTFKLKDGWSSWAKDITLTAKGKQMGLVVMDDGDGVTGRICDVMFGKVEALRELEKQEPRAMEADYTVVNGNATEFLSTLQSLDVAPDKKCNPADVTRKKAHFALVKGDWRVNHPPAFPAPMKTSAATRFEYTRDGLLNGAFTTLKVEGQPTDPDGDPVSLSWKVYNSDGSTSDPKMLTGSGLSVTWHRLVTQGQPDGGVVSFVAHDKWGDSVYFDFCVQGYGFRC